MFKFLLLLSLFVLPTTYNTGVVRWGQVGHRATGYIAEQFLTPKAATEVHRILGGNSLAEVSTWMDNIKSDDDFRHMSPWHYCTIPEGNTYEEAGTPEEGDIIWALDKVVSELKAGGLSPEQEAEHLKILVHLVGDIHQPLHVGNGTDRGGNDVEVSWFGNRSNLHRVWDSEMIDSRQLDGSELAEFATNQLDEATIKSWQNSTWHDWAVESQQLHKYVYNIENGDLGYRYLYQNFDFVKLRIAQAGVRLAGLLNEIYAN